MIVTPSISKRLYSCLFIGQSNIIIQHRHQSKKKLNRSSTMLNNVFKVGSVYKISLLNDCYYTSSYQKSTNKPYTCMCEDGRKSFWFVISCNNYSIHFENRVPSWETSCTPLMGLNSEKSYCDSLLFLGNN